METRLPSSQRLQLRDWDLEIKIASEIIINAVITLYQMKFQYMLLTRWGPSRHLTEFCHPCQNLATLLASVF